MASPFVGFSQPEPSFYLGGVPDDVSTVYSEGITACVAQLSRAFAENEWEFIGLQAEASAGRGINECRNEEE